MARAFHLLGKLKSQGLAALLASTSCQREPDDISWSFMQSGACETDTGVSEHQQTVCRPSSPTLGTYLPQQGEHLSSMEKPVFKLRMHTAKMQERINNDILLQPGLPVHRPFLCPVDTSSRHQQMEHQPTFIHGLRGRKSPY